MTCPTSLSLRGVFVASCASALLSLWATPSVAQDAPPPEPAAATSPAQATPTPKLAAALDAALRHKDLSGAQIGVHVIDLRDGRALYARQADQPLNPASNVKLLTAAAALYTLGPEMTWRTRLIAARQDGDRVEGLTLQGGGESMLTHRHMVEWATTLKRQGVGRVTGELVIDDTAHQGSPLPPGFEQKDEIAAFRAPIGAMSVNFNAVEVIIRPGDKPGDPARLMVWPPNAYVTLVNGATTVDGDQVRVGVTSSASATQQTLTVKGKVGVKAPRDVWRLRVEQPWRFAAEVMRAALHEVGIAHEGGVRQGLAPKDGVTLLTHESEPLTYTLLAMNKSSNNFIAEQLLRALGAAQGGPGSSEAGKARVLEALKALGVQTQGLVLHNGSGLYVGNLVSPRQFTQLLAAMRAHAYGPEFLASLPLAGRDGTMRQRLKPLGPQGLVRAKTGTLNEVVSLAGYARTKAGREVAFCIIFDQTQVRAWKLRDVLDQLVERIASSDE